MKTPFYYLVLAAVILLAACQKETSIDSMNTTANATGKQGSISRFAVNGNYMYVLDQNRVVTYSISQANNPQKVNQLNTDYGLETITLYEGTIYIGSRTALYILDISNPSTPVLLSKTDRDITLQGGCDPVAVKGDYAYSTIKIVENVCGQINSRSQLLTYDVSNKQNPQLLSVLNMNEPNGLGYSGNTLFVCDAGENEVSMFDISNPGQPNYFSHITLAKPVDVIINGNRMIASTQTGFTFFDITDIYHIHQVGSIVKQ